jgi:hypothetical protein
LSTKLNPNAEISEATNVLSTGSQPVESTDKTSLSKDAIIALTIAGSLTAMLAYWFSLDHHIPTTDEAGHIMASLNYAELYSHSRILRSSWWMQFLTVSPFYPPTTYLLGGIFKIIFHGSRAADVALQCFYCALLSLSTFSCARSVGLSRLGAATAGLVIGLYPGNNFLNHAFLLDLPLASAVAAGLALLLWWQNKPTMNHAIITGIGLGLACLTKQLVACYLIPAGLVLTLATIFSADKESKLPKLAQLLIISGLVALVCLPWVIPNWYATAGLAAYNRACMAESNNIVQSSFLANLATYLKTVLNNASPLLTVCALGSFCTAGLNWHKKLLPATVSAVLGILFLSTCNWCELSDRYTMAALIPMAIFTGLGAQKLVASKNILSKLALSVVLSTSLLQYISLNYCTYPISNAFISEIAPRLKGITKNGFGAHAAPRASDNWGAEEALKFAALYEHGNQAWFNILINQAELNAHTLELIVRESRSAIKPTTSLQWTLAGDKLEFSEKTARYYHWYLLKSGNHGYKFFNKHSADSFNNLTKFIKGSGVFDLKWTKELPDGETLSLYRQR